MSGNNAPEGELVLGVLVVVEHGGDADDAGERALHRRSRKQRQSGQCHHPLVPLHPAVFTCGGANQVYRRSEFLSQLQSVSIAQWQGLLESFCVSFSGTAALVWPTSLGNFRKNFLANLVTELMTHSVY